MNLVEGEPCIPCAERLLETLPGIFHTPYETVEEAAELAKTAAQVERDEVGLDGSDEGADYEEA